MSELGATCVHTGTQNRAAGHTIHSQEYGQWVGRVYDVYERMNYVYTFEKPKVWTLIQRSKRREQGMV
jgi:hypothetical protein